MTNFGNPSNCSSMYWYSLVHSSNKITWTTLIRKLIRKFCKGFFSYRHLSKGAVPIPPRQLWKVSPQDIHAHLNQCTYSLLHTLYPMEYGCAWGADNALYGCLYTCPVQQSWEKTWDALAVLCHNPSSWTEAITLKQLCKFIQSWISHIDLTVYKAKQLQPSWN